ncbi:MAG: glycoside hydrolase family 20 zincin-like fold domain-containing protein, partial [Cyclobacteriaceae bacterium]|nr:glycoside hydrolase family 20 zincin-like fold domain-containing protein [Cyclobacteriaceae bacterium]
MKKHTLSGHLSLVLLAFALTSVVSCTETQPPTDLAASNFIPMPVSVTSTGGAFTFTEKTSIYVQDESLNAIGQFLAGQLTSATGFTPTVEVSAEAPADGHLYLAIAADEALGNEGYSLTIATEGVLLTANQPEGIFRGIQTLRQALPVGNGTGQTAVLATGSVRDYPLYGYRGSMLDVSRH